MKPENVEFQTLHGFQKRISPPKVHSMWYKLWRFPWILMLLVLIWRMEEILYAILYLDEGNNVFVSWSPGMPSSCNAKCHSTVGLNICHEFEWQHPEWDSADSSKAVAIKLCLYSSQCVFWLFKGSSFLWFPSCFKVGVLVLGFFILASSSLLQCISYYSNYAVNGIERG